MSTPRIIMKLSIYCKDGRICLLVVSTHRLCTSLAYIAVELTYTRTYLLYLFFSSTYFASTNNRVSTFTSITTRRCTEQKSTVFFFFFCIVDRRYCQDFFMSRFVWGAEHFLQCKRHNHNHNSRNRLR